MVTKRQDQESDRPQEGDRNPETTTMAEAFSNASDERDHGGDAGERHMSVRHGRSALRTPDGMTDDIGGLLTAVAVGGAAVALEAELLPGILIGAGALLLGRMFGGLARPLVKTAIRAGYALTESAREAVAEAGEQVRDMVAEVEAERGDTRPARRGTHQTGAGGAASQA